MLNEEECELLLWGLDMLEAAVDEIPDEMLEAAIDEIPDEMLEAAIDEIPDEMLDAAVDENSADILELASAWDELLLREVAALEGAALEGAAGAAELAGVLPPPLPPPQPVMLSNVRTATVMNISPRITWLLGG